MLTRRIYYINEFSYQAHQCMEKVSKTNLQESCTNCFCPLSFHEETAIMVLWMLKRVTRFGLLYIYSQPTESTENEVECIGHTYPYQVELLQPQSNWKNQERFPYHLYKNKNFIYKSNKMEIKGKSSKVDLTFKYNHSAEIMLIE